MQTERPLHQQNPSLLPSFLYGGGATAIKTHGQAFSFQIFQWDMPESRDIASKGSGSAVIGSIPILNRTLPPRRSHMSQEEKMAGRWFWEVHCQGIFSHAGFGWIRLLSVLSTLKSSDLDTSSSTVCHSCLTWSGQQSYELILPLQCFIITSSFFRWGGGEGDRE